MKFALMAERSQIGNDEPWNQTFRPSTRRHQGVVKKQETMTVSARSIAIFAAFKRNHALQWLFAAAVFAAVAPASADARVRMVRAGAYDGTWNVVFTPQRGNCSQTASVPFFVSGSRVSSAGGGRVTGGIGRGGAVSVTIS